MIYKSICLLCVVAASLSALAEDVEKVKTKRISVPANIAASLPNTIRTYIVVNDKFFDNNDTLLNESGALLEELHPNLASKLTVGELTESEINNLRRAGIKVRSKIAAKWKFDNQVELSKKSTIIALGISSRSGIVWNKEGGKEGDGLVKISKAPKKTFEKNYYPYYIMLLDVTEMPARFLICVTPDGLFIGKPSSWTPLQAE